MAVLSNSLIQPMAVFVAGVQSINESKGFFCQPVWHSFAQLVSNLLIRSGKTLLILCSLFQCTSNLVALGSIGYDFVCLSHFMPLACFANTRDFSVSSVLARPILLCFCCSWNVFGSVTGKKLFFSRGKWMETCGKVSSLGGSRKMHCFWDVYSAGLWLNWIGESWWGVAELKWSSCFELTNIVWFSAISLWGNGMHGSIWKTQVWRKFYCRWEALKQFSCESPWRTVRKNLYLPPLSRRTLNLVLEARNMWSPRDRTAVCGSCL